MPVTGWLRGTVKAVPSGDTVLIVANAGPTVRRCFFMRTRRSCLFFASSRRREGIAQPSRSRSLLSRSSLFAFFFFVVVVVVVFFVRLMSSSEMRKSADKTKLNNAR